MRTFVNKNKIDEYLKDMKKIHIYTISHPHVCKSAVWPNTSTSMETSQHGCGGL
jgi:hypothetical protein